MNQIEEVLLDVAKLRLEVSEKVGNESNLSIGLDNLYELVFRLFMLSGDAEVDK